MASKTLVLMCLFAVLLVVSEVAAASDTVKSESKETVQLDGYGTYGGGGGGGGRGGGGGIGGGGGGGSSCRHGCCYIYRITRRCAKCCSYAGQAVQTQPGH